MDMAHKIIKPETYACKLCSLTHSSFGEKRSWRAFKREFEHPLEFYHKDEFVKNFRSKWLPKYDFPVILRSDGVTLEPLLSSSDLEKIQTLEELITLLKKLTR